MPTSPLAYDGSYWRSKGGILKIACVVATFVGLLCIVCSSVEVSNARGTFYVVAALLSLGGNASLLFTHLLQVWQRKCCQFPVSKYESIMHAVLAVLCFIASGMVLSLDVPLYTAAAFFGLLAFSIHAMEFYLNYRLSRQRTIATQTEV